jgi:hypothetical protein
MINHHNCSRGRLSLERRLLRLSCAQKPAETSDLVHFQTVGVWTLEECALRPNDKCELVISVWLNFTYLANQFKNIVPRQITRKFAIDEAPQKNLQVVTHMRVHRISLSLATELSRQLPGETDRYAIHHTRSPETKQLDLGIGLRMAIRDSLAAPHSAKRAVRQLKSSSRSRILEFHRGELT